MSVEQEIADIKTRLDALEIYTGMRPGEVVCSQNLKNAATAAGFDSSKLGFVVYNINQYLSTTIPHEDLKFQDLATFLANPVAGHHFILTGVLNFTEQNPSATIGPSAVAMHFVAYTTDSANVAFGSNLNEPEYFLGATNGWEESGPLTVPPQTAYYMAGETDSVARVAFYAYVE